MDYQRHPVREMDGWRVSTVAFHWALLHVLFVFLQSQQGKACHRVMEEETSHGKEVKFLIYAIKFEFWVKTTMLNHVDKFLFPLDLLKHSIWYNFWQGAIRTGLHSLPGVVLNSRITRRRKRRIPCQWGTLHLVTLFLNWDHRRIKEAPGQPRISPQTLTSSMYLIRACQGKRTQIENISNPGL